MKLSDLTAKTVLSLKSGRILGVVAGVHINRDTYEAQYISIAVATERTRILAATDMYAVGDVVSTFVDAIDAQAVDLSDTVFVAIGMAAYDVKGASLGALKDYPINVKTKTAREFVLSSGTVNPAKLVAAGDCLVFNTGRQLPVVREKRKTTKTQPTTSVVVERPPVMTHAPRPTVSADYGFLLGRTTKRSISDIGGQLLIPIGTVISARTIDTARRGGKLSELAIVSR